MPTHFTDPKVNACLAEAVSHASVGIVVFDGNLRVQQLNDYAIQIFKGPRELQIGHTPSELLSEMDIDARLLDQIAAMFERTLQTGQTTKLKSLRVGAHDQPAADKQSYFDLQLARCGGVEGGEFGIILSLSDVTDYVLAERRCRVILDGLRQVVWGSRPDGYLDYVNRWWLDYSGLPLEGAYGWKWEQSVHPEDLPGLVNQWKRALAERSVHERECRIRSSTGEYRWHLCRAWPEFDESGRLTHWWGTNTDIHDKRLWEDRLYQNEERIRLLVSTATEYVIIMLDPEGRVMSWNDGAQRIFGYEASEVVGKSFAFSFTPEDVHAGEPERQMAVALQAGQATDERWHLRRNGERFFGSGIMSVIRRDGQLLGFSQILRDHTDRILFEESLRRANLELEQFASIAAHDLQEPLRMVANYLGLLRKRYADALDSESIDFMSKAIDGTVRMQRLIQQLLELAQVERRELKSAPVCIAEVVAVAVRNLSDKIRRSETALTIGPLPTVAADESLLVGMFQNLIGNALKYKRPGVSPEVRIEAQQHDREWILSVSDNGIGIPKQDQQRIFEIFTRLHSRSEFAGTGLGLAICKRIAERHGGRIWVESEPGVGSTFRFALPLR